jgi:hypothetical protein
MSKDRPSAKLRRLVKRRAGDCCEYCRSQEGFCPESFSTEHIIPRSRAGPTLEENLAHSRQGCNSRKSDKIEGRDPASNCIVPLFHPRLQRWSDHFAWDSSWTRIVGLTPTGRATIEELDRNREGLVNLRQALHRLNLHPPAESGPASS